MIATIIFLLLLTSLTYSQSTIELYLPDVGGIEYNNQSVKVWDALSGYYFGERYTVNSRVVFDNITSVETEALSYIASAGYDPTRNIIYFNSSVSGKSTIVVSDILGQTRKTESYIKAGRVEVNIRELNLSRLSSGYYALIIITPAESYSFGLLKTGDKFSSTKAVKSGSTKAVKERLSKSSIAESIKIEVTHEEHYKRTVIKEKTALVEDYVVGYVNQIKTNGTPVTPEEFRQYCQDFNFLSFGPGLKSFFPNENKQIWIASRDSLNPSMTFQSIEQMESIRDLIIQEIYPYIEEESRPSFFIEDPANPLPISFALYQEGKILIMPKSAGYSFGVGGDPATGIIKYGIVRLYQGLDLGDITQPPANDLERNSRMDVLEEVASCFMGPRGNQGGLYTIMYTIMNGGAKMHPIDIKLMEMTQKIPPMTKIDEVLKIE